MDKLKMAVLKTLAYSSVFDYPLRISEIQKFLIGYELKNESELKFLFRQHNLPITQQQGYFTLTLNPCPRAPFAAGDGRRAKGLELVHQRRGREGRARRLLQRAKAFTEKYLRWIPTLRMVAVTGSTAALNASKTADIDLLIITQKNARWLTRALVLAVLEWQRERIDLKKPATENAGKFCLNIVLDEDNLVVETHRKASLLYVANEIARMKVVLNRDEIYERFLEENAWVWEGLPNWQPSVTPLTPTQPKYPKFPTRPLEKLARWYQLKNKDKWKQVETDHSEEILQKYQENLRILGIHPHFSA